MTKSKTTVGNSNYDKIKNAVDTADKEVDAVDTEARTSRKVEQKVRPARKKVYEQVVATQIPQEIVDMFAKDEYELRWVRFNLGGEEDLKNLSKREREGYEFVTTDELPEYFLHSIKVFDGKGRQGLITSGDVCLMKVDVDLRKSRAAHFKNKTDQETRAADVWNITKKKGLIDTGSRSSVSTGKEPTFQ